MASPLTEAFRRRFAGPLEVSSGVAVTHEMAVLVGNRLADVAIGPSVAGDPGLPVVSEPTSAPVIPSAPPEPQAS